MRGAPVSPAASPTHLPDDPLHRRVDLPLPAELAKLVEVEALPGPQHDAAVRDGQGELAAH